MGYVEQVLKELASEDPLELMMTTLTCAGIEVSGNISQDVRKRQKIAQGLLDRGYSPEVAASLLRYILESHLRRSEPIVFLDRIFTKAVMSGQLERTKITVAFPASEAAADRAQRVAGLMARLGRHVSSEIQERPRKALWELVADAGEDWVKASVAHRLKAV